MNILMSLIIGVTTGIAVAMFITAAILEKYISFGDNKGEFKTFSKYPIRMISRSDGNGWFKV